MSVQQPSEGPEIAGLCEADGAALDAVLAARAAGSEAVLSLTDSGPRVERVERLLALLDADDAAPPPDDLVSRTMERVRASRQRERFAQQVQMLSTPPRSVGFNWRQIVMAASIFLIAASLLLPVLEQNKSDAQRVMGASNLMRAGSAFQQYGTDHSGLLPQRAARPGDVWWNVGQPVGADGQPVNSNSAHLFVLVRGAYLSADDLSSPANPHAPNPGELTVADHDWRGPEQVSFSYQNQYGRDLIRLDEHGHLPVLANRNPIFVIRDGRFTFDPTVPADSPSRMHKGRGQNVLLLDGRAVWMVRPVIKVPGGEDNIWGARGETSYDGDETPADANDSFLVP